MNKKEKNMLADRVTENNKIVMHCPALPPHALQSLLSRFGLILKYVNNHKPIPGSFWGDSEAGLIGNQVYLRNDTPVHSVLHEACHYICMDQQRRKNLHTNAGGHYAEENAVCYLQILLSDYLEGYNRQQIFNDMDNWGYSFRLGASKDWFEQDATDAYQWLVKTEIIQQNEQPNWKCRQ